MPRETSRGYPVVELCAYQFYPKTLQGPAEYCPEEAQDDSEYCPDHDPDNWQPDWDDRRKDLLYGRFDCD